MAQGMYSSSIYFRRAEDISIERPQCSISRQQWDSQLECGTLTNGIALTMRQELQFGSITQSVRGHNQTLNGT
eukprot:1970547-Amphidinium_carterae.2